MDLKSIYEANFGEKTASQETEITDEQINDALSKMSQEDKVALAKEIASDIQKESGEEVEQDAEKTAEELFAAGRIFGQGVIAEMSKEAGEEAETGTALDEFAQLLNKEIEG